MAMKMKNKKRPFYELARHARAHDRCLMITDKKVFSNVYLLIHKVVSTISVSKLGNLHQTEEIVL